MSIFDGQAGIAKETTWGTPVTVSRFFDVAKSTLKPVMKTVESKGIRAGRSSISTDQVARTNLGTEGTVEIFPGTKGFGLWLEMALGSISSGAVSGGKTPHTATVASTAGKSFTFQHHTPYQTAAGGITSTVAGCKVTSLELSHEVGSNLEAKLEFVGKPLTTATAKATASYPSGLELFAWDKVTVTIGGTAVCGSKLNLSWDNQLKGLDDATKFCGLSEPTGTDAAEGKFMLGGVNLESATHFDRILAAVAEVAVVITCTGTTDTAATLVITLPACVAESGVEGLDSKNLSIEQDLEFRVLSPAAGGSPITAVYTTTDVAP